MLDRFVKKHGERMRRVRSKHGSPTAKGSTLDWRRDAESKEMEDKLAHAIKRGLPHLVPRLNKVLRKLEVQELSLREFSDREADFINLLVELVSEEPALTLKSMIDQEMKKLAVF